MSQGRVNGMLKVLIADDEKMICSLISQLLDWNALGYEIVGMAYTGVDAYEMIRKEQPDVIISDIRMPGYDGIELIKRTKEAGIEAEFVMISGFKQFEYAQNAMKYGVKYYLLKPIEEDKLQEIAEEIKDAILSRKQHDHYRNQLELEIQETRDKMKKRFLTSMLFGEQESRKIADCNSINQEYSTSFKEGVFQAVFIKVDTDGGEEESIGSMIEKLEKYTDILGDVCEEHITTEMHSGIITLVNYKFEQEALVRKKIEEMYEEIKKYIDRFEGFSVVLGVGRKMDHFLESNLCLKTAIDAIKYRIRISNTNIIYLENYQFEPYDIDKIVTEGKKQAYLSKVVSGDIRGAQECLAATLREIRYSGGSYSPILFFDILIAYVDLLTDYCKQQDLYSEEYERNLKKWNVSTDNIRSEKMLLAVTEELIRETLEYAAEEKKSKDIKPIREIKKYIEENYMEEISLGQLAELVDMNASYLSSVFKKETGMTYSEYLILCRVKQASRLLVETNLSIGEIAHQSGYQDARYFSKQFSKQVGLKPSEYRKLYS